VTPGPTPAAVDTTDGIHAYYADGSLSAATYDAFEEATRPLEPEVAFYRGLATGCTTPIIELGVGTGRIAWPLAEAGHTVVGLDSSTAMLARAIARRSHQTRAAAGRLQLVRGDMRTFELGFAADLVILPHRSFNHLLTPADQRACLTAIRRHLGPRGRAVIDLAHPGFTYLVDQGLFEATARARLRFADGFSAERVAERRTVDFVDQILTIFMRYTLRDPDGRVVRETVDRFALRWTNPHEMRLLLELSGLAPIHEHADFAGTPPTAIGDRLWVVQPLP